MDAAHWDHLDIGDWSAKDIFTTEQLFAKLDANEGKGIPVDHDDLPSNDRADTSPATPSKGSSPATDVLETLAADLTLEDRPSSNEIDRTSATLLESFQFPDESHTEAHLVVPKFNRDGIQSILSLVDGHSDRGLMEFHLHTKSDQRWNRATQILFTACPAEDEGKKSEGNWVSQQPSTFPINPPERLANHLTKLIRDYSANRTRSEPKTALYSHGIDSTHPELVATVVAKDLLKALNRQVKSKGRQPSWYHWPVTHGDVSTLGADDQGTTLAAGTVL